MTCIRVESCDDLYEQVRKLPDLATMTGPEVGRSLFGLVDAVVAGYKRFRTAITEVCLFDPPGERSGDVTTLAELGDATRAFVLDVRSGARSNSASRPGRRTAATSMRKTYAKPA